MILELDDWHLGYDQIIKDTRVSEVGSVWVLANADVDSLAAARILTYMFRADGIPYQLRPCWSYSSLKALLESEDSTEIRALVLLNQGASRNLTKLFDEDMLSAEAKIYVMDCRKPVHLANVHAGHNVVIFWDETQNKEELPSDGDNLSGNASTTDEEDESSDQDSDDDSDDDDNEDPDEGEVEFEDEENRTREKTTEKPDMVNIDEAYDGEDEYHHNNESRKRRIDDDQGSTKRYKNGNEEGSETTEEETDAASPVKESMATPLTPHELHQQRRSRLRTYYSGGSFYCSPVAWVAYRLATQKRWNDNGDLLWLACIGLTDAYLHARIDMAGYASLSVDLKTCCQRIFPNEMVDRVDKTVYAESLTGKTQGSQTQVTLSDNGKVLAETDYRFFLLRHSSLFDSMMYSSYVASRLQVWTPQGKQRLQEMLAKMGFPLDECRQPFAFMNPHLKRKLRDKLGEYAPVSIICNNV
jgi:cell division control protein 45